MRLRHKFNAKPIYENMNHFASTKEWEYFKQLELRKKAGDIVFFLRQVPFHLPGGVKYVVDYQIFNADGSVVFVDVKGFQTSEFKAKKKIVEELYPIEIEIV